MRITTTVARPSPRRRCAECRLGLKPGQRRGIQAVFIRSSCKYGSGKWRSTALTQAIAGWPPWWTISLFLLALVHRSRLDRQLAEGVDPDQSPALSLRARQLQGMRPRRSLANSLERDIEMTERYPDGAALPISRAEVTRARPLLLLLLERLREPGAVSPRGVVMVRLLLSGGRSLLP